MYVFHFTRAVIAVSTIVFLILGIVVVKKHKSKHCQKYYLYHCMLAL